MGIGTLCWYIEELLHLASTALLVLQGYRDETFGMPLMGLVLNISWSFWFGFYVKNVGWWENLNFWVELVLLGQTLFYGPKEFFDGQQKLPFYGLVCLLMVPSLGLVKAVIDEQGRRFAHNQLFYVIFLISSMQYVPFILSRGNARGQNVAATVCRSVAVLFSWFYQPHAVTGWLCFATLLSDGLYFCLLILCLERPQLSELWRNFLVPSVAQNNHPSQGQHRNPLLDGNPMTDHDSGEMTYEFQSPPPPSTMPMSSGL